MSINEKLNIANKTDYSAYHQLKEHDIPYTFLEICLERINRTGKNSQSSCECMGLNPQDVRTLSEMGYKVTEKKYWMSVTKGE